MLSEEQLHYQVADYLNISLPAQTVWHHSPNEGQRRPQYIKKLLRKGLHPGWPDFEIIYKGRIIFIELKTPKGRVSKKQKQCHHDLMMAGAVVKVCRSLDEVAQFMEMTCGYSEGSRLVHRPSSSG